MQNTYSRFNDLEAAISPLMENGRSDDPYSQTGGGANISRFFQCGSCDQTRATNISTLNHAAFGRSRDRSTCKKHLPVVFEFFHVRHAISNPIEKFVSHLPR